MRIPARRTTGLEPPVLFFDGVCGLCNSFVDFVIRRDQEARVRFSPLQSSYATRVLDPELARELKSVVLRDGGQTLQRSDAVLRLCSHLGGIWRLAGVLRLVPRPIRDSAYDFVAKRRYGWFGRKESCRIPTPSERARFILD